MYRLFIGNKNYSSWSLRPWVLLSERGIPFTEQLETFKGGYGGSVEAFRAFSPSGRVPCLHDGDVVVWDSLAIAEYVAERHEGVWPKDAKARAWARSAAAEMHSGFGTLREICTMNCGLRIKLNDWPRTLTNEWTRMAELWNDGLARFGGPFLAGRDFTAVDAFFAPVAFRVQTYAPPLDDTARAYAQRLLALPSMLRWYTAALAEPWRDEAHELEASKHGTVTADLRARA